MNGVWGSIMKQCKRTEAITRRIRRIEHICYKYINIFNGIFLILMFRINSSLVNLWLRCLCEIGCPQTRLSRPKVSQFDQLEIERQSLTNEWRPSFLFGEDSVRETTITFHHFLPLHPCRQNTDNDNFTLLQPSSN